MSTEHKEKLDKFTFTAQENGNLVSISRAFLVDSGIKESILLNSDIFINGEKIPCEQWESLEIAQGDEVSIYPNIHGYIAGIVAAAVAASGTIAYAVTYAVVYIAIMVAASFALNWLVSKLFPQPETPEISTPSMETLPTIEGAQNQYRPFEPLPVVIGTMRTTPDFAVPYYSVVTEGGIQEIYHCFCVSAGAVDVWDIRKEDTSVDYLDGIEYRIHKGWTGQPLAWFDDAVNPIAENFSMKDYAVYTSESPVNSHKYSFQLVWTGGLKTTDIKRGSILDRRTVFIATFTDGTTTFSSTFEITNPKPSLTTFRAGRTVNLPHAGEWRVQIYGYAEYNGKIPLNNGQYSDYHNITMECFLADSQWRRDEPAITYTGQSMTLVELKVTASDKLTGGLSTINCMARMMGKRRDGALVDSSNIALQARRLMTDENIIQNTKYVALGEDSFDAFEAHCDKYGFTVNGIENSGRTLGEVLSDMLELGQGYISGASGVYQIFYDNPAAEMVDVVTSRNSWGMSITSTRPVKGVDGLRITFLNAEKDYQVDERLVAEDGVNPVNAQSLNKSMIDNADMVYKYGMLSLAMGKNRNSIYKFSTDWRSIDYMLGQKLLLQHPAFFLGIGTAGMVVDYIEDGGLIQGVVLDQYYPTDLGKEYILQSSIKGSSKFWDVEGVENATTNELYFTVPILTENMAPQIGDILAFGESEKVGVEVLIRNITRNANFSAEIECLPASDRFYEAITGVIPPWESSLTFPNAWDRDKPSTPIIAGITVDQETATRDGFGRIKANAVMSLTYTEKRNVTFSHYLVSIREYGSDQSYTTVSSSNKETFTFTGIYQDVNYQIKVVAVSTIGVYSTETVRAYYADELMQPLQQVTGFGTIYRDGRVNLFHDAVFDWRPVQYEVRQGVEWETGIVIAITDTTEYIPLSGAGVFYIKAKSGLAYSSEPSILEVENVTGEGLPINVIATMDEAKDLWDGSYGSDFVVTQDNALKLAIGTDFLAIEDVLEEEDILSSGYSGGLGTYYISPEKEIVLDSNSVCSSTYSLGVFAYTGESDFLSIEDVLTYPDILDGAIEGYTAKIEVQKRISGVWGQWETFYPAQLLVDGLRFRLVVEADQNTQVEIRELKISVDVPDKIQNYEIHVTDDAGGYNLEFVPPFNAPPTVVGTILDTTGTENLLLEKGLVDKFGALIRVEDTITGQYVARNVNIIAKGY